MLIASLTVAAGGFFGAVSRYAIAIGMDRLFPRRAFPWATLFVNVSGSFAIGWIVGSIGLHSALGIAFGTGFLGAYTTFSTFKLEMWKMLMQRRYVVAAGYLLISYWIGMLAAIAGFLLGEFF